MILFAGPFLYIALSAIGLALLWRRPHYAFAATFAVCLFVMMVSVPTIFGGHQILFAAMQLSFAEQLVFWSNFLLTLATIPLGFFAIALLLVALRKRWAISGA